MQYSGSPWNTASAPSDTRCCRPEYRPSPAHRGEVLRRSAHTAAAQAAWTSAPVPRQEPIGPRHSEPVSILELRAGTMEQSGLESARPGFGRRRLGPSTGKPTQLHLAREIWPHAHGVWERTCIECTGKQPGLAAADPSNEEKIQRVERVASGPQFPGARSCRSNLRPSG